MYEQCIDTFALCAVRSMLCAFTNTVVLYFVCVISERELFLFV
jgi:hypothetical protein